MYKKLLPIIILNLFIINHSNCQESYIKNLPLGIYTEKNFTENQKYEIETQSQLFTNLSKVNSIQNTSPYVYYNPNETWGIGTWGRGYETLYTPYQFYSTTSSKGDYYACHPMTRDASNFIRGHINLYNSGFKNGLSLNLIKNGIDFILSQINMSNSSNRGGITFWYARENQTNINMNISKNTEDDYETAYGLAALTEFYLSNISYKRSETLLAIQYCSEYLLNRDYTSSNSNVRGLAIWALANSYKVTRECNTFNKIKQITNIIMNDQVSDNSDWDGAWKTGSLEPNQYQGESAFHDTKIFYHFMTLRGLVEVFSIIPDQDAGYKESLLKKIRRAFNHVINYRLYSTSANDCRLKYLYKTELGTLVPWNEDSDDNIEKYIETTSKFLYYSKNSNLFTTQDRINIKNLTFKLSQCLSSSNKWHITGIGYYLNYINAYNNNLEIYPNWSSPNINYNSEKIENRTISGDFDNDGFIDDIAAFYDYGLENTRIHVWKSNVSNFNYQNANGWWSTGGYNSNKISSRLVCGDFDNDGFNDDIAAFYDYGNQNIRIHIWTSTGSSFIYKGEYGWWNSTGYDANKITGRIVAGDFDNDGFKDDIAAFYDYGNQETRIHLWKSNGSSFIYSNANGWWKTSGYDANKISNRVISGDFNKDGIENDIAAFYDYGNQETRIHVWNSNSYSFIYSNGYGWWNTLGYDANKTNFRVLSGDFDNNGYKNDIAAFYDYGNQETRIHLWKSSGSSFIYSNANGWWKSFGYDANMVNGRILNGDFDNDGFKDDIAVLYKYGFEDTRIHSFKSNNSNFVYSGPSSLWLNCWYNFGLRSSENNNLNESESNTDKSNFISNSLKGNRLFNIYPNPSSKIININYVLKENEKFKIYDINGNCLNFEIIIKNEETSIIDISNFNKGIYFIELINSTEYNNIEKLIVE